MILEGFEIENWSCLQRVAVADLPPTGVVVLHGPNGTGKSSIIEALRACLLDSKSTSKALGRGFPKNSSEKPRVSVTFRSGGQTWRITKQFATRHSKLERRTAAGEWKLESADPTEAHERTQALAGGACSERGLYQLLWLTQAEFHLPDPKQFDANVQAQLRGILGVLQTPLDDCFLGRVKENWSRWFSARSKPGEKPKLKKDCSLDKGLALLDAQQREVDRLEERYRDFEQMMERSSDLEIVARKLQQQIDARQHELGRIQEEYERSLTRLEAYRRACERVAAAEKNLQAASRWQQKRTDIEEQLARAQADADRVQRQADEIGRQFEVFEDERRRLLDSIAAWRDEAAQLQARRNELGDQLRRQAMSQQLRSSREALRLAEEVNQGLETLQRELRERPAPDSACIKHLEDNRTRAAKLRANLEAASMVLCLRPDADAALPRVTIDGSVVDHDSSARHLIRTRAELTIPGWGRIELTRGSDARTVEQMKDELQELDCEFADLLAPFRIDGLDPAALDQVRALAAEKKVRDADLQRRRKELERIAPQGIEPLRNEVLRLDQLAASAADMPGSDDSRALDSLCGQLKEELVQLDERIATADERRRAIELQIEGAGRQPGLRQQHAAAKVEWAVFDTTAAIHRGELERMLTTAQIDRELHDADEALHAARDEQARARLSDNEETIHERLQAAKEGLRQVQKRLEETQKEYHEIKGALQQTEGLHQERTAAAIRCGQWARETERERLEADAYDLLYALFEECREKQLGAVMGPIQDRVLRWMRLVRIGNYDAVRFNDQFLLDKLVAGGGAVELNLKEESTGTIEQIALMIRLALGSLLSTAAEPVTAVLDDPLTHSDGVRLDRMRAVLRHAAAGDAQAQPPAGPLQVIVFTCHPEWFAVDGATTIDLTRPDVLNHSRSITVS
jgi:predicted  nucleic acid-binding Zn-ribbon protein